MSNVARPAPACDNLHSERGSKSCFRSADSGGGGIGGGLIPGVRASRVDPIRALRTE